MKLRTYRLGFKFSRETECKTDKGGMRNYQNSRNVIIKISEFALLRHFYWNVSEKQYYLIFVTKPNNKEEIVLYISKANNIMC